MKYFHTEMKKRILLGQEIVKEYDFLDEIDVSRSDHYFIDDKEKYLEFFYSIIDDISLNDYRLYRFGSFSGHGKSVYLLPSVDKEINDSIKRSQVFVNKPISPRETPIIHLNMEMNAAANICIWIGNNYVFETHNSYLNGTAPWDTERKECMEFERTAVFFNQFSVNISQYSGKQRINKGKDAAFSNDNSKIDCYIDIQKGYLKLGRNGKKVYHKGLIQNEGCSINISCNSSEQYISSDLLPGLIINRFELCKSEGIVYFKPFNASAGKALNVSVIYKGNVTIQYLSEESKKWITVIEGIGIKGQLQMSLRAFMNTNDRIHDLLILKTK